MPKEFEFAFKERGNQYKAIKCQDMTATAAKRAVKKTLLSKLLKKIHYMAKHICIS